MKKTMADRFLKRWKQLVKQQRRIMRQMKKMRHLLAKTFSLRALTPKPLRRISSAHKIAKSVHKNQDVYLTGIHAIVHTIGNFFRVD